MHRNCARLDRSIDMLQHHTHNPPDALCEDTVDDPTIIEPPGYRCREDAAKVYGEAFEKVILYLKGTRVQGPIVEFGTYRGFTARRIAELVAREGYQAALYLYDSFEGFPDHGQGPDADSYEVKANGRWQPGRFGTRGDVPHRIERALGAILSPARVHVVKGFFDQTLDRHLPQEKCALVHVDCDLYSSAKYVLGKLYEKSLYQDGCVVLFDDYNCNRANPMMGERRALREFLHEQPRWQCSPWFSYGWHGQAFIFHDSLVENGSAQVRLPAEPLP
jgi:O-methyltransferase